MEVYSLCISISFTASEPTLLLKDWVNLCPLRFGLLYRISTAFFSLKRNLRNYTVRLAEDDYGSIGQTDLNRYATSMFLSNNDKFKGVNKTLHS